MAIIPINSPHAIFHLGTREAFFGMWWYVIENERELIFANSLHARSQSFHATEKTKKEARVVKTQPVVLVSRPFVVFPLTKQIVGAIAEKKKNKRSGLHLKENHT